MKRLRGWIGRNLRLRTRFEARVAPGTANLLTPYLTVGGLLLTAIGVAGGMVLSPSGLLGNVLANMVLIGPALVISNLAVAYVRRTQSDHRAQQHAALAAMLLMPTINVANDYLTVLGSEKRCSEPSVLNSANVVDLRTVLAAIDDAASLVDQESIAFAAEAADKLPLSLKIDGNEMSYDMPYFTPVQTTVGLLDREIDCPLVLLLASAAEHFSRHCYVDFVWQGQGSPLRPLGEEPKRIMEPKIGFSEIRVWMMRAGLPTSGSVTQITIAIATYHEFVAECLGRSRSIVSQMIKDMPARLLAPASRPTTVGTKPKPSASQTD